MKKTSHAVVSFNYGSDACSEVNQRVPAPVVGSASVRRRRRGSDAPTDGSEWWLLPDHTAGTEADSGGGAGAAQGGGAAGAEGQGGGAEGRGHGGSCCGGTGTEAGGHGWSCGGAGADEFRPPRPCAGAERSKRRFGSYSSDFIVRRKLLLQWWQQPFVSTMDAIFRSCNMVLIPTRSCS